MKTVNVTVEQIALETGVAVPTQYDYVIIADGSGWKNDLPAGYGGFIYDIFNKTREEFYGGVSGGTNNYIELAPFFYALSRLPMILEGQPYKIACISDSEVTTRTGSGEYHNKINGIFWNAIRSFPAQLNWIWIPRNSIEIHKTCDTIGREIRLCLEAYEREY